MFTSFKRSSDENDIKRSLTFLCNTIIAPVADLLEEPEIIIVPNSCLYHAPFPALLDESKNNLLEQLRIRIVPSLTALKCIQDSLADFQQSMWCSDSR